MDESRRESVQKIVESSIDGLTQEDVDLTRAEARELLMALLAQAEFVLDDTASIGVGMQSPSLAKSERKQVAEK
jgi:hypothetical protein